MNVQRRHLLQAIAALAGTGAITRLPLTHAQSAGRYPERPIALVDAFSAGGSTDIFARLLAEKMGPILGTAVIVENRVGSGGAIGSEYVARAKADGYTLGIATVSTLATNPAVASKPRYDPLKDFAHISNLLTVPSVLVVHPSVPARNLKELIELSKAKPDTLGFATPGIGSAGHVLLEQFMRLSGAKFLHVPYRGASNVINDLLGGQIMIASDNLPSMLPHVRSGKVRAIAVRDNKRLSVLPQVPTYAEEGYAEVSEPLWFGLVAPAGTPRDIVMRLNAAVHQVVATPAFKAKLESLSASSAAGTPEQFAAQAKTLLERYRRVAKESNIHVD